LRVFSRGNSRAIFRGPVRGEVSVGVQQSTGRTRLLGARSGGAGPESGPLGVTSRSAPFGRLPCHCSDQHVLIVPFHPATIYNSRKPCLIPPFSADLPGV